MRFQSQLRKTVTISNICLDVAQVLLASALIEPVVNKTANSLTAGFGVISTLVMYWISLTLSKK